MIDIKYSSYAQIDRDLEILRIEKELSYQKLINGVQETKDSLTLQNIVSDIIGKYSSSLPYGAVVSTAVPFILNKVFPFVKNWFVNRKRGN
jgi:hypothetical protein